ncbi:MAG: response regulator [Phycisphaerae bacterium]
MTTEPTVFVVDDDLAMRQSLVRLLESVKLKVATYPSAEAFLVAYHPSQPGCLVLDICMPGISGLELQDRLLNDRVPIPIIIMSAHGDVEKAVRAMKAGAVDFVKKPYNGKQLLACIRTALERDTALRRDAARHAEAAARAEKLTPREREIMAMLVDGKPAKRIAFELGLSRKTVDVHRGHVMSKMQVESVLELARLAAALIATDRARVGSSQPNL